MKKVLKTLPENFVWQSYSDLVTGLMISFILIFIVVQKRNAAFLSEAIEPVVKARAAFNEVNRSVIEIITKDKRCENAIVKVRENRPETIQIIFKEGAGNSWFRSGDYELRENAKECLAVFSKNWLSQMYSVNKEQSIKLKNLIIEGHTNSLSRKKVRGLGSEANYVDNLELSQQRAFETAKYMLDVTNSLGVDEYFNEWKRRKISANGRSFSDLIKNGQEEDYINSRRVEFHYTLEHDFNSYGKIKERFSQI